MPGEAEAYLSSAEEPLTVTLGYQLDGRLRPLWCLPTLMFYNLLWCESGLYISTQLLIHLFSSANINGTYNMVTSEKEIYGDGSEEVMWWQPAARILPALGNTKVSHCECRHKEAPFPVCYPEVPCESSTDTVMKYLWGYAGRKYELMRCLMLKGKLFS